MNLATLNIQKATLTQALHELNAIKVICHNCTSYHGQLCAKYQATPPPDWISKGPVECEHWEYDGIPF